MRPSGSRVSVLTMAGAVLALLAAACAPPGEAGERAGQAPASMSPAPSPSTAAPSATAQPPVTPSPSASTPAGPRTPTPTATPAGPQLPRGGRTLLPHYRVVAYYGHGRTKALGVLGERSPEGSVHRLEQVAGGYATEDRPVQPAFELIVTVAHRSPGPDGNYSAPSDSATIDRWLVAARKHKMLLVLDIQPGKARFLPEVKRYDRWLRQPDVGLALDPEWRMSQGGAPGSRIGSVDVSEINEVSAYLAGLVKAGNLPQKLLVVHQFTQPMIRHRERLVARPGLATLVHLDGFGTRAAKLAKLRQLRPAKPFFTGFKLFYDEDVKMFAPREVLAFRPAIDYVSYQ